MHSLEAIISLAAAPAEPRTAPFMPRGGLDGVAAPITLTGDATIESHTEPEPWRWCSWQRVHGHLLQATASSR